MGHGAEPLGPASADHLPLVVRTTVRGLVTVWLRTDVGGVEHLPATGPAIIAANHRSHADSLAIGVAATRPVRFLGTAELMDWPVVGRWLPALGMVPIERGAADLEALRRVAALLDGGQIVVIYPEGGRTRDGRVHRPRGGLARLAAGTGAPVVPCGIAGTERAWPVDDRPRLGRHDVRVRLGAPLPPPAVDPRSRRRFAERLHGEIVRLSGAPAAERQLPDGGATAQRRAG